MNKDTADKFLRAWWYNLTHLFGVSDKDIEVVWLTEREMRKKQGHHVLGAIKDDNRYLRGAIFLNQDKFDTYQQMLGTVVHELAHFTIQPLMDEANKALKYVPENMVEATREHLTDLMEQTTVKVERLFKDIIYSRRESIEEMWTELMQMDKEEADARNTANLPNVPV